MLSALERDPVSACHSFMHPGLRSILDARWQANIVYILATRMKMAPPSLVVEGEHTLLLQGGLRGFDPDQLQRTKSAFFP